MTSTHNHPKKHYYDRAISYDALRDGLNRCCRGVRWKDSVVGYEHNAAKNTHGLRKDLLEGKYRISPYQTFTIHEPKEREIVATRIRDRQMQMALCQSGLYDDMVEHFIYDNCACQIGKGTDFALKRLRHHLCEYYKRHGAEGWILKCDIRKFFPSTSHEVAKAAVRKRVADEQAREMVCRVIDSFAGDRGIGLGSQISQLVELAVLDDLDHYIKEELKIRHYVRYMDDFILIHEDKEYLKMCREKIAEKVKELDLELNAKTCMFPFRQGVKFIRWRFWVNPETGKIIQRMDGKKLGKQRRKLKRLLRKEHEGTAKPGTAENSLRCWLANAEKGDTWGQRRRMVAFYRKTKGEMEGHDHQGDADSEGRA